MVPSSERASFASDGQPAVADVAHPADAPDSSAADERLADALAQQRATREILAVMVASRNDATPVFETIARAALALCRAASAVVATYDGALLRLVAVASVTQAGADAIRSLFPRAASRDNGITRAVLMRNLVSIPDVLADPDYATAEPALASGFRSVLALPLLQDGAPIGAISLGRVAPGAFPDNQVALLRTFADQAVIALENVRLFREVEERNRGLAEALEQQTATSDILRVISASRTDVQPVFETIARAALRFCRAEFANVFTFDGSLIHLAAIENANADYVEKVRALFPRPPGRGTAVERAIATGRVCIIPDVLADPDYVIAAAAAISGYRSVLAVPLMRDGCPIGTIAVGRPVPGPFPERQVALMQTFADQAVIAIENVRLFGELQARTAELTRSVGELRALGEISQAVNSTLDLETVLSTIVARATQLTGMDGGTIYEYDEERKEFHLHTADRLPEELVAALRAHPIRRGEGALGRMAIAGEPVQIADIVAEGAYQSRVRDLLVRLGYRALLAVPLMRDDRLLGGLAVNRKTPGPFGAEVIALLETFAAQSALAIQNARLFRELEVKGRALEQASRHKSEFLANMSHELRTPLNAIIGFSEVLAERMFGDINDKQAEYLGDILESARHLLALINDVLDLSKIEAGRIELDLAAFDVARALDNTLLLVRERAQRRGLALVEDVATDLGIVVADERKFKQVVLNLLSNAVKFTPPGGTVTLRALDVGDAVEVSVRDTGVGIAAADQALVFEEFRQVGAADRKSEGTGLGLAISRRFVELHGGTIRVDSDVGLGSTFTVRLPRGSRDA
jgi:signal transduction histidine kinase